MVTTFSVPSSIVAKYGMVARDLQKLVDEGTLAVNEAGQLMEVEKQDDPTDSP